MAENDVGGIGVKFTAEAAQLQQELSKLEQRLKQFDSAHGQKKIRLQAELVMPGARVLQDFRRDLEKGFGSQGSAGRVKARIELIPPTAQEIKALTGKIGDVKVKVIGNFEWGTKPPKTVTVKVVEESSGQSVAAAASSPAAKKEPIAVAPATARAASTRTSAARRRSARVENVTWTQADLDLFSLDALRDQIKGTRGPERAQLQAAITQREREGRTNVGGYTAGGYKASQPGGGGARGLTGGMTGAYGRGAPQVAHWSQGSVPYQSVPAGPTIAAMGRRGEFPMPMRSIYNPYPAKGTPQPPEWRPGDLGNAPQLSEASLTRRLRQIVKTVSPEAMQAGQGWYQRAGEIAQGLGAGTGLGRAQISGATASFSQNAGWSENVRNAQDFFEAFRRGARTVAEVERHVATIRKDLSFNALGLEGRTQSALKAAMAETPRGVEEAIGGPKVQGAAKIRAFHKALMGDPTSFTVDRHMALMMSGGTIGSQQKMHTPFQRAGQRVAGEMGMSAADLQAVLWTNALGPQFAGADPYGQMRAGGPGGIPGGARGLSGGGFYNTPYGSERRERAQAEFDRQTSQWGLQGAQLRFRQPTGWENARLNRGQMAGNADAYVRGPLTGTISMGAGLFDPRNEPAAEELMQRRMQKAQEAGPPWSRAPVANIGLQSGKIEDVVKHEVGHLLRERLENLGLEQARGAAIARRPRLGRTGLDPNLLGGGLDDPERLRWAAIGMSERIMNKPPSLRALEDPQGHEAFAEGYAHADTGVDLWGIMDLLREGRDTGFRPYPRAMRGTRGFAPGQTSFGFGLSGGARGATGGDDPYTQNQRSERRRSMRDANAIKAQAREAEDRARADEIDRKWAEKGANLTEAERFERNAELAIAMGKLPVGGNVSSGIYSPRMHAATLPERAAVAPARGARPAVAAGQLGLGLLGEPRLLGGTINGVPFGGRPQAGGGTPPLSPFAGPQPGPSPAQIRTWMAGGPSAYLPGEQRVGESGLTAAGLHEATAPRRLEEAAPTGYSSTAFAGPLHATRTAAEMAEHFGALPASRFGAPTAGTPRLATVRDIARPEIGPTADLDTPAYLRRQGEAIGQGVAHAMAAEPPAAAGPTLQEHLNPPSLPPPPPTAAGAPEGPDDEIGHPSISARALARAGLDPSGKPLSAEAGSPQARVQELLKSSREAVQLAQGTGQVRAVGTTTGGLFANLLGGKAQRELVARDLTTLRHALEGFTAEGTDAHRAFSRVTEAQTRFNQATLTGTGNVQALGKELQEAQQNAQPYVETVEAIGSQINKLQGQISPLKQATIGFGSSIAGTIVGLGIFNAVSAGIEGIGNALKEPSDRLLGFRRIGEQTGLALGQATRQMHGFSEGAVSATAAQSGLGDSVIGQIRPLLQQRAAVEAGNTAFREQLDLIRSAGFFERNPGAGITQTTGGLLGTPIGGQQPFLEQLLQSGSPVGGPLESKAGRFGINLAAGAAAGAALGTLIPIPGLGTLSGALAGGAIGGISGLLQTADMPESTTLGQRARSGQLTEDEQQRYNEFGAALATINDGLEKANPKLKETAHFVELLGNTGPAANEAVAATQKLLSEIPGITADQLQAAKDLRFALIDPKTGTAARVAPQGLQRVLTEALRGVSLPSRQEAAFQTARGLTASLDLNQQQNRLQRETLIPGQSFLRQLAAGRAPTGGRVNIGNPLTQGTTSLPPEILNRPGIDTSQLSAGLGQVETQANAGREALVGMIKTADNLNQRAGISSNLLGTFNDLTEAAGKTAATIRGISQASAWMQVNLQVKQINEQIYVMSRSLADAQSFLSGTGSGELGLLQNRARSLDIAQAELGFRQQSLSLANQELGITATTLQLQQRQRQINFQRAIAGFVTPGQTPEEIAARQEEARLEADFAQRQQDIGVTQLDNQRESVSLAREQLGISREQFAIQQAMIQVSAERAVGDLARGIALLQEQAQVTVQLQVNADAVAAYQAVLEEQMAQIESVIQEAYNVQQQVMSNAAALAAQYGGRITEWNNILIRALADYVGRAGAVLMGFNEQIAGQYAGQYGQTGTSGSPGTGGARDRLSASGYYGNVSGATQFTVGEAGPETVAIIRNPRNMTWQGNRGGGGEGVNINITVTGNNVGSQQDADELAATIARKVEESMSRRSSLLGLRSN